MVQNGRGTVAIDPDNVARAEFSHAFRGYDTHEVQAYLVSICDDMQQLRDAVAEAESRVLTAASQQGPPTLTAAIGGEAARVLQAAEDSAADIRARAEDAVARMLRDAQDEVTAERSRAQQERSDIVATAGQDAEVIRLAASAELEQAQAEGRAMVDEAREIRERVLSNLSEKRQIARRELTQLRAGIDELRGAYGNIEELLAASVGELDRAVPSARAAAMRAGERVPLGPEPYVAPEAGVRLEIEVEDTTTFEPPPVLAVLESAVGSDDAAESEPAVEEEHEAPADLSVGQGDEDAPAEELAHKDEAEVSTGGPGTVIDLQARRAALGEELRRNDSDVDEGVAGEADLGGGDDDLDPELPAGDAIDARRQAERRQLFEPMSSSGDTVLEFAPVLDAFGPAEEPVPLVPPREPGDIDELFARIRNSRADAVAQAREVLHRTSEIPISYPSGPIAAPLFVPSDGHLTRRDQTLHDLLPGATIALKRMLGDQLNEVLDALRRTSEGVSDIQQLLPETLDRSYGEALREQLVEASRRGAVGGDADIGPVVRALGSEVGGSLRGRIAGYLQEPDQLERRVRAVYREWRRDRVDGVVGDGIAAAFGLGLLGSLPEGTAVRWIVPEGGCCGADCYDNSLATDVSAGEPFPTGDVMAPARPGCRGLVVPAAQ